MFTLLLLDRQLIDEEVYKQNVENYDQIEEKLSKLNEQITLCVSKKRWYIKTLVFFFCWTNEIQLSVSVYYTISLKSVLKNF